MTAGIWLLPFRPSVGCPLSVLSAPRTRAARFAETPFEERIETLPPAGHPGNLVFRDFLRGYFFGAAPVFRAPGSRILFVKACSSDATQ